MLEYKNILYNIIIYYNKINLLEFNGNNSLIRTPVTTSKQNAILKRAALYV